MGVTSSRCAGFCLWAALASLSVLPRSAEAAVSLSVDMSASPSPVPAGAVLTYTITVTNNGDITAQGLTIDTEVPADTTFISASDSPTLIGNQVLWSGLADLPGFGGSKVVTLRVDVDFPVDPDVRITNAVVADANNASPASDGTITEVRGLGVNMSVVTEPADCLGSPFRTYVISFANGSTNPVTNLKLSADIPPGTVLSSAPLGGALGCSGDPATPCTVDSDCPIGQACSKVFWDIGTMAPAELSVRSFTASINGTEPAGTTYDSSATLGNGLETGGDSAPTTSVEDLPCPVVEKVDLGPPTVEPGGVIQYRITAVNLGRVQTTNSVITDTVPPGTDFGAADPICSGATGPAGSEAGGQVVWNLGAIAPDGAVVVCLDLDVRADIANSSVTNTATFTDDEGDSVQDTEATAVQAVTALDLTKDAQPSPVEPGEQVTYTLTFRNVADFDVTGVVITDDLNDMTPAGCVTLDPVATAACGGDVAAQGLLCSTSATACSADSDCSGGETCSLVRWDIGSVVPSAERSVCYVVTVGSCDGQLRNVAQVTDDRGEVATATAKTRVTGTVALRLFKEAPGQRRVRAGDDIFYTLRVQNLTGSDLANVTVTDDLDAVIPAGALSFASAANSECGGTADGGGGSLLGNIVSWTFATLPPGEQTACLRATTSAGLAPQDVIQNFAEATDGSNLAEDSITTKIFVQPFRVRIVDENDPVTRGQQISYLISVENLGSDDLAGVTVKSRVPSGTTLDCVSGGINSPCPPETDPAFQGLTLTKDPSVKGRRAKWAVDGLLTETDSVKKMRILVTVKPDTRRQSIRNRARARETSFRSKGKARAITVVESN